MTLEDEFAQKLKERLQEIATKQLSDEAYLNEIAGTISTEVLKRAIETEGFMDTREIEVFLRCSTSTIRKYCAEGMPYIKSSPNLYEKSKVLAWIYANKEVNRKAHSKI